MVPEQPTIFSAEDEEEENESKPTATTTLVKKAVTKYNHRKLSELSHHLIESKRWDDAQKVAMTWLNFLGLKFYYAFLRIFVQNIYAS